MNRKPIIKHLGPWKKKRTIVISDIHGNLDAYLKLLDECDYQEGEDRLLLLGDLIEKGPRNLETLRTIIRQSKQGEVHALMGNCDFTIKNAFLSYRLDFLKQILMIRKNSILHEMASAIGIEFHDTTDMEKFCNILRQNYYEELAFCNDLPHILESDAMIFTHAGIQSEENFGDDFRTPMTTPLFLDSAPKFNKTVVCGHMPVTEYQRHIAHFDPLFSPEKNIYCIDGGNIVKKAGQLNALIFQDNYVEIKRCDLLETAIVKEEVPYHTQIPFFITWNHGQVDLLKKEKQESYVYSPYINRSFWVDNSFLQIRHGQLFATDYTNYQIPLRVNDKVKIVHQYQDRVQIKKDGVLGWCYQRQLKKHSI
ncbi:metallophosphoesterase [Faecalicoccus acidiformans]|uniref:Metallophosphoesterase n=1 Tax=Faecalicoccus acidiformans TaxID=915173 RepID=A0ABS2FNB9_9FIRM|nr:metallophosphoesterase [Faecalicoccus acidiformans]MBM6830879.1 metallophosphoesterase [Faecalicoccus acidiformans]